MAMVAAALPQTSLAMSMRRAPADRAVGAVGAGRDRALDHRDVGAGVGRRGLGQRLLGLVAGRRHDRLVIVDRERVQDDVGNRRPRRAQERLGVAGAVLELEPDQTGFSLVSIASAILARPWRGIARTDVMTAQKPMKSRRDTPRLSSSSTNQLCSSGMTTSSQSLMRSLREQNAVCRHVGRWGGVPPARVVASPAPTKRPPRRPPELKRPPSAQPQQRRVPHLKRPASVPAVGKTGATAEAAGLRAGRREDGCHS